jgi:hypothetical protein
MNGAKGVEVNGPRENAKQLWKTREGMTPDEINKHNTMIRRARARQLRVTTNNNSGDERENLSNYNAAPVDGPYFMYALDALLDRIIATTDYNSLRYSDEFCTQVKAYLNIMHKYYPEIGAKEASKSLTCKYAYDSEWLIEFSKYIKQRLSPDFTLLGVIPPPSTSVNAGAESKGGYRKRHSKKVKRSRRRLTHRR